MERIQKVIASSGYCSRRKAEELIKQGKVMVNGNIVLELGTKVDYNDKITVDGVNIASDINKIYILLYKPRGIVSTTSDDKNRKTVVDLLNISTRVYPVGRLDYDTTGALLLTNDGELTNKLIHPKNEVEKIYVAKVAGIFLKDSCLKMSKGVVIDGVKTSKAKVKTLKIDKKNNTSYVEVIIHEGRNHQVKKMFEALHYDVIKLKRESFAGLTLDGLKSGEFRYLSTKEVKILYSLVK